MVGNAIVRKLKRLNCKIQICKKKDVDLRSQLDVLNWMKKKPQVIFLAAAKVGGIFANMNYPKDFLYDNIMISFNVINAAKLINVEKLIYLGSSCIYLKKLNSHFVKIHF